MLKLDDENGSLAPFPLSTAHRLGQGERNNRCLGSPVTGSYVCAAPTIEALPAYQVWMQPPIAEWTNSPLQIPRGEGHSQHHHDGIGSQRRNREQPHGGRPVQPARHKHDTGHNTDSGNIMGFYGVGRVGNARTRGWFPIHHDRRRRVMQVGARS